MLPAEPGKVAREAIRVNLPEGAGRFSPDASIGAATTAVHSATYFHDAQRQFAVPRPGVR